MGRTAAQKSRVTSFKFGSWSGKVAHRMHLAPTVLSFGPFELDAANARLLKDRRPVPLTPKALDVLAYLASRPQRLVTKDELLSSVWPDVVVGDASVKVCIREVRAALGDDAREPRYIETVHRKGYRFIAEVRDGTTGTTGPGALAPAPAPPAGPAADRPAGPAEADRLFVGRERELARLLALLARAAEGQRQIVFVSGDAGAGKSTLVEALARHVPAGVVVATGHCFEHFGSSEPYMPIFEALTRLEGVRRPASAAPQPSMPSKGGGDQAGVGAERVLRELAEAVEASASAAPGRTVMLVVEDLHWADYSTLDLVSALARRRGPARLMVVGTYRPGEASETSTALAGLTSELVGRGLAEELSLGALDEYAVERYVSAALPDRAADGALALRLHRRTGGHPLFVASVVREWLERSAGGGAGGSAGGCAGGPDEDGVPGGVRAMIEGQLARLSESERAVVEAAAAAGVEFSAAAVAAALGMDVVEAERACEDLARRRRFIEADGADEWSDGTVAGRFRFLHELYHNVAYGGIPPARCVRLHAALGERLEQAHGADGGRDGEHAAELAMHFERARRFDRALAHLRTAAARATRQYAHREAVGYLRRALAAAEKLPDDAGRAEHELPLLMSLGVHLQVTLGFAADEVRHVHARALALCEADSASSRGDPRRFPVLFGVWLYHKVRSSLREAEALARRLLALAEEAGDAGMLVQACQALAVTDLCLGRPLRTVEHMRRATAVYDPALHGDNTQHFGQDPGVSCLAFGAVAAWIAGLEEESELASRRSLELAEDLSQPSTSALAMHFAAMLSQVRGRPRQVEDLATHVIELSSEEGFSFWRAGGIVLRGWARARLGEADDGIEEIRRGLAAWLATGSRTYHTYYLGLLADALLLYGRVGEAEEALAEALVAAREMPEGLYEAELHRLLAECHRRRGRKEAARQSLARAVEVARQQGARHFEMLAARDL